MEKRPQGATYSIALSVVSSLPASDLEYPTTLVNTCVVGKSSSLDRSESEGFLKLRMSGREERDARDALCQLTFPFPSLSLFRF